MIRIPSFDQIFFGLFVLYAAHVLVSPLDGQIVVETGIGLGEYGQLITGAMGRVIFGAYLIVRLKVFLKYSKNVDWFILALAAFALLTSAWSVNPFMTAYRAFDLLFLLTFPIVFIGSLGWEAFQKTLWWTVALVLLASSALAVVGSPYALMGGNHDGLWRGLFQHKNTFGPFAVLVWVLTIYGINKEVAGVKFRIIVLGAALVATLMSGSATAYVLMGVVIGWGWIHSVVISESLRLSVGVRRLGIFILLVATVGMASLLYPVALDLVGRDESLTGRTALWSAALAFIEQNPLGMGYGLSGGEEVLDRMRSESGWLVAPSTHNGYITMALDVGWPMTLVYILWLLQRVFSADRSPDAHAVIISTLAVYYAVLGIPESTAAGYLHLPLFLIVSYSIGQKLKRPAQDDLTTNQAVRPVRDSS